MLAIAALIAVGYLTASCSPTPVTILPPTGSAIQAGVVLSLTGSQSATGQMAKEGYLYCQDWVNAKGGIILNRVGHRLNLDIADDQSRPSVAASVTEQLISGNHDPLLLGPSNDTTARRVVPVAEQHQVPIVGGGVSSDSIFNNPYHYLFSVLAPHSGQLHGVIDMALTQDPKPVSVALIYASDSLSAEVANATAAYAQANGLTVVYGASYAPGVNDVSGPLRAVAGAGPDLILEVGHPAESIRTVQQARQMNIAPKLLAFSDGPETSRFITDLRNAANFSVGATQWVPAVRNPTSYFLDSFHYALAFAKRFGHAPDQYAAAATAACLTLEVAIERAGSIESAKVRDALAAIDLKTFFGRIKFDERGANTAKPIYVQQVQSGLTVLVWPPGVASARARYPDPGWAKH